MKTLILVAASLLAPPALAMTLQGSPPAGAHQAAASDPDARLEGLAAASSGRGGATHGRPEHSSRSILKDDPNLRRAYAWLDNK